MLTLLQDKMDTPLGPLWVLCDEQFNLRAVEWDEHRDRMETLLDVHYRREGYQRVDCRNPGGLSSKLSDYFAGDLAIIETLPTATAGTNGANPVSIVVPCHRVIGRNGTMTGYAGGVQRKEWLLRHEGYLLL